jgi:hypothetical protein
MQFLKLDKLYKPNLHKIKKVPKIKQLYKNIKKNGSKYQLNINDLFVNTKICIN